MFNQTKQVGIWEVLDFRYTSFDHTRQPMAVWDFNSGVFPNLCRSKATPPPRLPGGFVEHPGLLRKFLAWLVDRKIYWVIHYFLRHSNFMQFHDVCVILTSFTMICLIWHAKKTQSNIKNMCAIMSLYFVWYVLDMLLYSVSSTIYS